MISMGGFWRGSGWVTDQRSMAGTAPTDFHFTRTLDAGPVHCSVWLSRNDRQHAFPVNSEFASSVKRQRNDPKR
jgi:hypothetical protein